MWISETLRAFSCPSGGEGEGEISSVLINRPVHRKKKQTLLFKYFLFLHSIVRALVSLSCFYCLGFLLPTLLVTQMQFLRS